MVLSRGGSPLQPEVFRSCNSAEPSRILPTLLCLCARTAPCTEQAAAAGQAFQYSWDANKSKGEKF